MRCVEAILFLSDNVVANHHCPAFALLDLFHLFKDFALAVIVVTEDQLFDDPHAFGGLLGQQFIGFAADRILRLQHFTDVPLVGPKDLNFKICSTGIHARPVPHSP